MATEQSTYRATNDAYTGMLAISLVALILGSVLLFLDYSQHSGTPPKTTLPPVQARAADEKKGGEAVPVVPPGNNPMPMPMPAPEK